MTAARGVRRFTYLYDFGDHWEHVVEVKPEIPLLLGEEVPILLAGERRCPPEHVGSLSGFEQFLQASRSSAALAIGGATAPSSMLMHKALRSDATDFIQCDDGSMVPPASATRHRAKTTASNKPMRA